MAWAITGKFTKESFSQQTATYAEQSLKRLEEQAQADPQEKAYIISAKASIDACQRSLDTIYKGRELNFIENDKMMKVYSDAIVSDLKFGTDAKDFFKSLPTMTVSTAGGITLVQALNLSGVPLWGLGIALAAAGYLVNLLAVKKGRHKTQRLYVMEDFNRDLFYDQYVSRVGTTLLSLYLDINDVHQNVFGDGYPSQRGDKSIIDDLLAGVRPTFCRYLQKHMSQGKVTPELWPTCETGIPETVKNCPNWEGERK
jgi:hypothetical protein